MRISTIVFATAGFVVGNFVYQFLSNRHDYQFAMEVSYFQIMFSASLILIDIVESKFM